MTDASAVGLMRNLGRFFGHLVAGVQSTPEQAAREEIGRRMEEQTRTDGVILRRTVIEEVEVPAPRKPSCSESSE